jgi:hypothetical protein
MAKGHAMSLIALIVGAIAVASAVCPILDLSAPYSDLSGVVRAARTGARGHGKRVKPVFADSP